MEQQLNGLRYSTSKKNFTFSKTSFHHRKLNMKHLLLCCDHVFSNEQNTEHSMSCMEKIVAEQEHNYSGVT